MSVGFRMPRESLAIETLRKRLAEDGPAAIARSSGLTTKALRKIIHGESTDPHASTLRALQKSCGIPLEWWWQKI